MVTALTTLQFASYERVKAIIRSSSPAHIHSNDLSSVDRTRNKKEIRS